MADEDVLRRWFSLEMGKIMETFVATPRPLLELLREERPSATTRSGEPRLFDKSAMHALADALPALTRAQLRLPITVHIDNETPGDVYTVDPAANEALCTLHVTTTQPRDGKLWMSAPLARDFARRYPTVVQFVMH